MVKPGPDAVCGNQRRPIRAADSPVATQPSLRDVTGSLGLGARYPPIWRPGGLQYTLQKSAHNRWFWYLVLNPARIRFWRWRAAGGWMVLKKISCLS
jgi:hypothetical protein